MTSPLVGARARVRAEITTEILAAARAELDREGAAALSLRSVARQLGTAPSALYRYFASRDALLTALIIEAFEDVGAVAERAVEGPGDRVEKWQRMCLSVREWARANPSRWALIYGSPVPGYVAPRETVPAAMRITQAMASLVPDKPAARGARPAVERPPLPEAVLAPLRDEVLPGRPPSLVGGALLAWTALVGMVTLELFGHYVGAATDFDAVFDWSMRSAGHWAGIA